jgi:hypothetical protein
MDTLDLRQGRPEGTGLARQRQADPKCKAAYPDLRNRFWALWAKLEATPIETPDATIGSDALFELFAGRNDWKAQVQGLTGYPPKIIAELEDGNPRTLLDLQADRIRLHPTPESVMAGLTGLDADILAFATDYLRLRTGARTGEALGAVLTQHFDGETFQRLAAFSSMMDAGQLAQVFDRIGAEALTPAFILTDGSRSKS